MAILPRPVRPSAAWADLREFLAQRRRHQWVFAALSLAMTVAILVAFQVQTSPEMKPRPVEILYFQVWPEGRTIDDIRADQARDAPAERAQKRALEAAKEERRRSYERLQEKMRAFGF